ncbi:hypothetical protein JCM19239_2389 [Vibrio variabilis]|uniref:Uncharacterized protein n=1 Tax=Vibrio variabilis TaxID=990271 RepID=A0ABQ0JJW2_9VIBR|nr:hypothetical protein JCM19239_2389 [Vibrio variabilis]
MRLLSSAIPDWLVNPKITGMAISNDNMSLAKLVIVTPET